MFIHLPGQVKHHVFVIHVNLVIVLALKEGLHHQKDMEDDSRRKYVTLRLSVVVLFQIYYLRSHITWSAASEEQIGWQVDEGCQAEIHDHQIQVLF